MGYSLSFFQQDNGGEYGLDGGEEREIGAKKKPFKLEKLTRSVEASSNENSSQHEPPTTKPTIPDNVPYSKPLVLINY